MRVSFDELKKLLKAIMIRFSFDERKAEVCADIFASNSRDGVYSHGLNRFPVFIDYVRKGLIHPNGELSLVKKYGQVEVYDGQTGPGMYNASVCTSRAVILAKENGIGCVTVRNNNHWMRGGTYGWQAADAGCIAICFTNAIAGMPPWGGKDARLGNNPLVIAVPRKEGNLVLDMAMSQYSYGKMQEYEWSKQPLPFAGGFDESGNLSHDPAMIRRLKTALPIGFWKGSGLAFMLDIVLTALGGGKSTAEITGSGNEIGLSQTFICIYQQDLHQALTEKIIEFTKTSTRTNRDSPVRYPGENTLATRIKNMREGIPVNQETWEAVKKMME
ncbi:MAG: 3-dehydro-L-gulonate 2-dehydrogenase [Bacteroidetes bacterium]|nr:MAG: 3-dehydro-L-gulonate 2-dehydrogenase [Bacteroidota bacterium]